MHRTVDYDYALPPSLIAQYPSAARGDDRLLVLDRHTGTVSHHIFEELPDLLDPHDLLVVNDSRVLKARLRGHKPTGGGVELLLVRKTASGWLAMVQARRGIRPGLRVELGDGRFATVMHREPCGLWEIRFSGFASDDAVAEEAGSIPLPPYIRRSPEPVDAERYQTVYAREPGSIAAPTAGLHFTPDILTRVGERGIGIASLTLHVGPGTFQPVRTEVLNEHRLDPEPFTVSHEAAAAIDAAVRQRRRIVAVGTTVTRVLETIARHGTPLSAQTGWTDLFIYPPFTFRVVGALLTNFHLPRSSLLALVCAFAGRERVLAAYAEAVTRRYRFYSYGDAMLIL